MATNESGYRVERSSDGGATWSQVGTTLPANSTSFDDTTAADGSTYAYRVGAVNGGDIAWSSAAGSTVSVLAAPNDLKFRILPGPLVRLTWTDVSTYESRYDIQRSTDGGATFTTIGTKPGIAGSGTAVTADDRNITQGTSYFYRVVGPAYRRLCGIECGAGRGRRAAGPDGVGVGRRGRDEGEHHGDLG